MPDLDHILFDLSGLLLKPCTVLLLAMLAATIFALGAFARESWTRRRSRRRLATALAAANPRNSVGTAAAELHRPWPALATLVAQPRVGAADIEKFLGDAGGDMLKRVERLSLAAKVGPMLGLMGTLIPLGPALRAMNSGSLGDLGGNLAVAFSMTVVGLAVAGPCFSMATVRKRWYEQDLNEMDLFARRVFDDTPAAVPS